MKLRYLLTILAFGISAHAFGQEPATHFKLRNVAAADAAVAVSAYSTQQKLSVTVVAEPRTNSLFVGGDAGHQKKIVEVISALDKDQPKIQVNLMIVDVPTDFAESTGLGEGEKWTLTARETRMLKAAIARDKGHGVTVISEPSLVLTDNKTGFFTTKNQDLTIRATPRLAPKGDSILMRVETQHASSQVTSLRSGETSMPVAVLNTQSTESTEAIPAGSTMVVRATRYKTEKEIRDVFTLVTSTVCK